MSWKASGYVKGLNGGMTRSEKLLMLIISDYFDETTAYAWPTVERLAVESLLTRRHVYRLLDSLVDKGLLRISSGRAIRSSNRYSFPGYRLVKGDIVTGDTYVTPDVTSHVTVAVNEPTADDDTTAIKPSTIFSALQSTEGPVYVDVSHPEHYDKGFHGDLSAFNAKKLNAYISKMDAVRRRHARYVSKINPDGAAELTPLLIRPRDLRVLFALAHQSHDWAVADLWDNMHWNKVSPDGHNILQCAVEQAVAK
jgi:hypothetical protein